MAQQTTIEWTDSTWNPLRGCTRVSEGCRNCYAEVMAARFSDPGQWGHGLAQRVKLPGGGTDHRWTGKVELAASQLDAPLRWRKPRRIFVNSTSDLFHEAVPDEWIDRVFAVMALAPHHTFQVLTKRPERMREYLERHDVGLRWAEATDAFPGAGARVIFGEAIVRWTQRGLPNVWLGTSVEDQATADARIPHLLATPAAVRFLSCEPLLGPVDLTALTINEWWHEGGDTTKVNALRGWKDTQSARGASRHQLPSLDWVICGGESGTGARPMHPDWARSLRDQCVAAGAAFFFKQWGEWGPVCFSGAGGVVSTEVLKVGKKAAGRLLDGRTWDQLPDVNALSKEPTDG